MNLNTFEIILITLVLVYLAANLFVLGDLTEAFRNLKLKFEAFYEYSVTRENYVKDLLKKLNGE
jgi:hypothetical protein